MTNSRANPDDGQETNVARENVGPIRSGADFLRRFMPREYERRKTENRCVSCGQRKPTVPKFTNDWLRERGL